MDDDLGAPIVVVVVAAVVADVMRGLVETVRLVTDPRSCLAAFPHPLT